ncbi:MAG: hypothetical protein NTW52_08150 [Planctomycetota bacterium]|nr:hypothetical protein [Planctomycetota bacterium]
MPLHRPKQQFAIETRAGRDGFAAIYTGRWGEPFTVETESVFPNRSHAELAKVAYQDAPQLDLVDVVWEDIDYTAQGVRFLVMGTEVKSVQAVPLYMGPGFVTSPAWVVQTTWTLLAKLNP